MRRCLCLFSRILGWRIFGQYVDRQLAARGIEPDRLDFTGAIFGYPVPWWTKLSAVAQARHRIRRLAADRRVDTADYDVMIVQGHDLIAPFRSTLPASVGIIADTTPAITKRREGLRNGLRSAVKRVFSELEDRFVYRRVFRQVDAFLVLSESVRDSLARDYGVDRARVLTVGPPVQDRIDRLPAVERGATPVILFVGNDFERKGGRFLLDLWRRDFRGRAELCVVSNGIGPDELGPDVRHYANVPNDKVLELMKRSHLFAFPSYHDELGLVLAEAACAGLPIVARESGGQSEYVREEINGHLMPLEDDREAWAAALESILFDPDRWQRYSSASAALGRELCTEARFERQFGAFAGLLGI